MCLRTHARRCVRDERPMDERASRQVSAPAGSGKTFLLRSWIGAVGLAESTAWVSVQREERNPQRFWVSVLSALRQTAAGSTVVRPVTAAPDRAGWGVVGAVAKRLQDVEQWAGVGCVVTGRTPGPGAVRGRVLRQ